MKTYLVGGAIRDALLGQPGGDRDWLVVGTTPQALTNTLRKLRDAMKESTAHGRTHVTADHHVGS